MSNSAETPDREVGFIQKNSSSTVRVSLRHFKGTALVDTRIHFDSNGEMKPSAKGVCIRLAQLPHLISLLQSAQRQAAELGMLEHSA